MDHEKRKMIALSAHMDGQASIVARIGEKVKVSQMELVCLTNFAEIGLMSLFSRLEGETGEAAERDLERHLDAIRKNFGSDGLDGLKRLSQSAAAMLRSQKFQRYISR